MFYVQENFLTMALVLSYLCLGSLPHRSLSVFCQFFILSMFPLRYFVCLCAKSDLVCFFHFIFLFNVKIVFLGAPNNLGGLEMLMNMFGGLGAGSLAAPRSDGYNRILILYD